MGITFPGIFNTVYEIEYGCLEPTIVDGVWIRPCMNSSSYGFTIPLLYGYHSTGPPFSIGVTVLDYQSNSVDCTKIVVDKLVVTIDGKSRSLLRDGQEITAAFKPYYAGTTSTKTDVYIELNELTPAEDDSAIGPDATVQVHTSNGIIELSVSGDFERGGWRGTWFILEALFPHA